MSDDTDSARRQADMQFMMQRLKGFARVVDLDEATTRRIIRQVVADMPRRSDEERLAEARSRMIKASM
ncbi:hypothetical protein R1A27_31465 (plasmid) [Methylobacterium sp. NMS12]|uniref:hypothetical protein n=1 Tax=Methylobacterium sp. NMS12 TaxID=3079766 RepID=UPI003F8850CE